MEGLMLRGNEGHVCPESDFKTEIVPQ
jgi:hypothetical protein